MKKMRDFAINPRKGRKKGKAVRIDLRAKKNTSLKYEYKKWSISYPTLICVCESQTQITKFVLTRHK